MSVKLMTAVFESSLPPVDRLVALVLADYGKDDGSSIFPTVGAVVSRTGLSERAVRLALSKLRRSGILTKQGTRSHPSGAQVPIYRLHVVHLPGAQGAPPPAPHAPPGVHEMHPPPAPRAPKPRTRTQTRTTKDLNPFAQFWAVYPLKQARGDAQRAFAKALHRADADTIIAGAVRYRDDPNREDSFTKYAQGWLNADRWNDGPLPPRGAPNGQRETNAERIARLRREDS